MNFEHSVLRQRQDLISVYFHGDSMDLNSPSSTYASLPSQLFFQHPLCSCMHSQSLRLLWQKNPTKPQNPQSLLSLLLEVFLSRGEKERLRNSSGRFLTQAVLLQLPPASGTAAFPGTGSALLFPAGCPPSLPAFLGLQPCSGCQIFAEGAAV